MCLKTKKKLFQRFSAAPHTHGKKWQIKGETEQSIIVCEQGKKNANNDALAGWT